ncbi:MAG: NTP transferase domain-containing protein [Candidatus Omnitrophota bacterium]
MKKDIACIILAAGKSTRMKSDYPKVLHSLCGWPMLGYILDLVSELKIKKAVAVLGYKHAEVRKLIPSGIKVVIQKSLLGTADAVKEALPQFKNLKGHILVLYGDNPLLKKETIKGLIKYHTENNVAATLLTADVHKPAGYGRVLRDKYSSISGIVEEKDADDYQKEIKEINTGIMCFKKDALKSALGRVRPNNRKKEYYLTDVIAILYKQGLLIDSVKIEDINEALGINSREELAKANSVMQERINAKLMQQGVTIIDPGSSFISFGAKIGKDCVIYPFTVIERNVTIGKRCQVGPFIHLREGTQVGNDAIIGNFVELVRSRVGAKTLVKHFSYLGDSRIGNSVNIGAGTITANFNGTKKTETIIKDKALIGSDTVLVAPVTVGRKSITGAGAVVTKKVPDCVTVVGVPARILKRGKNG